MRLLLAASLLAFLVGCEPIAKQPPSSSTDKTTPAPDNTRVNARDRSNDVKTPIDQNENQADIDLTAKIRKQVVDAKMSVDATNVKIITQNGNVTLRGPVKTEEEKQRIEEFAQQAAGTGTVDNQLEVKTSN